MYSGEVGNIVTSSRRCQCEWPGHRPGPKLHPRCSCHDPTTLLPALSTPRSTWREVRQKLYLDWLLQNHSKANGTMSVVSAPGTNTSGASHKSWAHRGIVEPIKTKKSMECDLSHMNRFCRRGHNEDLAVLSVLAHELGLKSRDNTCWGSENQTKGHLVRCLSGTESETRNRS